MKEIIEMEIVGEGKDSILSFKMDEQYDVEISLDGKKIGDCSWDSNLKKICERMLEIWKTKEE